MAEPSVLFVKPGAIKPNDKGRLYKAGVIVVEVEDPTGVNFVRPSSLAPVEELPHGRLLSALAKAIKRAGGYATDYAGEEVAKAIIEYHAGAQQGDQP